MQFQKRLYIASPVTTPSHMTQQLFKISELPQPHSPFQPQPQYHIPTSPRPGKPPLYPHRPPLSPTPSIPTTPTLARHRSFDPQPTTQPTHDIPSTINYQSQIVRLIKQNKQLSDKLSAKQTENNNLKMAQTQALAEQSRGYQQNVQNLTRYFEEERRGMARQLEVEREKVKRFQQKFREIEEEERIKSGNQAKREEYLKDMELKASKFENIVDILTFSLEESENHITKLEKEREELIQHIEGYQNRGSNDMYI